MCNYHYHELPKEIIATLQADADATGITLLEYRIQRYEKNYAFMERATEEIFSSERGGLGMTHEKIVEILGPFPVSGREKYS